jgi:hypothetical protein
VGDDYASLVSEFHGASFQRKKSSPKAALDSL